MRVMFIAETLDLPETHLLKLLAAAGIETSLMASPGQAVEGIVNDTGIKFIPLALRCRFDFAAIRAIRSAVADGRYDIVHCLRNNRPLANALFACRGMKAKIIAYRGTSGHLSRWDPGSRLTYLHPSVARIVCVSDAVRRYLEELGVPSRRLVTIYKGHDIAWYERNKRPDLEGLGIPDGAFLVVCAANMRPVKGVHVLVEAFRYLPSDGSVHLLLAGELRDKRLARQLARATTGGVIHWAGFRADAPALVGAASVFVMPSLAREGLPRALIEAMAQGVPAIVTNVGGMPELVKDGVHGSVVPPADPQAIAQAILRMAGDPANRHMMGDRARERIRTEFSIAESARKTMALYKEVLA